MSEHSGEGEHKLNGRWDYSNHPVGYILGVSPGFSQMGQGEERLINMGLARKIVKAARLGFDFTEIDYEALSEMYEPYVTELIKHVKEVQQMEVGLHLPVKVDLCIANAFEWKEMHEILRKGAFSAREVVGAKFFLFHTSSRIRPHVTFTVGHQEASVQQNSFSGVNLGQWMNLVDKGDFKDPKTGKSIKLPEKKSIRDWFKAMFTKVLYHMMGMAGDVGVLTYLEQFGSFKEGVKTGADNFWKKRQEAWDNGAREALLHKLNALVHDAEKKTNELNLKMSAIEDAVRANKMSQAEAQKEFRKVQDNPEYLEARHLRENTLSTIGQIHRVKDVKDLAIHGVEEEIETQLNGGVPPEKKLEDLTKEYKEYQVCKDIYRHAQQIDFDKVFDFWVTKGSECEEQVAYRVIAKFMFWTKDPIWLDIVGDYDPDIIIKCADLGKPEYDKHIFQENNGHKEYHENHNSHDEKKTSIDDLVNKLITAVACKYIEGHLFVEGNLLGMKGEFPDNEHLKDESVYKYTKDAKMMIFIETSMPPEGQEGELRIMSAHDHVTLAKHLDKGEITAYTMDFEHLTVNFVKVGDDIKSLKDGDAKYIKMMHINAPRPIIGAHAPVPLMSHDMFVIYKWLFDLRKKGMSNAYFIWEMGGFGIDQSAIAFRNMVIELAKDTAPDKLPARFYGLDETLWAAQHHAIREHGLDPLKGMIMVPEVDHGVFSKAAHEKGKAKEWEEEKYKY